jgi:hypothetical protein
MNARRGKPAEARPPPHSRTLSRSFSGINPRYSGSTSAGVTGGAFFLRASFGSRA